MTKHSYLTMNHWGAYWAEVEDGALVSMRPFGEDPNPSPIGMGLVDAINAPNRITAPMVRKSWLKNGPGANTELRGKEAFVAVDWPTVEGLVANEIERVRTGFGSNAIYGGSYGWASAGRFHHAQSQLKRFLNCCGGFTGSAFTYSFAAAEAMIPHVLGSYREFLNTATSWRSIAEAKGMVVAFGGMPIKNSQIEAGGLGAHHQRDGMLLAKQAGVDFISISPLREDVIEDLDAEWLAPRPNTDVAIMLGLAHTIYSEGLHDPTFLDRYCVGFAKFADYLKGAVDGVAKDADWAAEISVLPADTIRNLARKMAQTRTMISVSWSLTRQDHGEQPFWMAITLAAMLGQIGKPGGGFAFGYAAVSSVGGDYQLISGGSLPQGEKRVSDFIPVSRIAEMLENPGGTIDFNGRTITFPDIKMIWWAGGNPFHHHQDLNRLINAWRKPDTIICNEWCWNPLAKRADIVLPCTTHVERNDISLSQRDKYIVRMEKALDPPGLARDDYEIFRGIARRMGLEEVFTEGREAEDWIRLIYEQTRLSDGKVGDLASTQVTGAMDAQPTVSLPDWEVFCEQRWLKLDVPAAPRIMLKSFIDDPDRAPLATPSGKIEIFSETVAGFGYDDCRGHPSWFPPYEWLGVAGDEDLHLISNQPSTKLHSQLDHGAISRKGKIKGREVVTIHPKDAAKRGIADGDMVRLFNDRGACICIAHVSEGVREQVMKLNTGAWWDPDDQGQCLHGNPNAVTRDKGTSRLGQGPTAQTCLARLERAQADLPSPSAFQAPEVLTPD